MLIYADISASKQYFEKYFVENFFLPTIIYIQFHFNDMIFFMFQVSMHTCNVQKLYSTQK